VPAPDRACLRQQEAYNPAPIYQHRPTERTGSAMWVGAQLV